ncbi:multicomponent Na+:H+ antiporter subunit B [Rhodobacter aestuarii]|uniref:Multicomponent Na+:H+ antiporter subunit B n=1 Tax=Rhodobacter aestuarii TaxID=453582 RepID=A0A1N7M0K8_9RHOB|nr:hydrogen gas-evolving membrane-bound hydrogenase subunit E [Rhodobacter aestuarii]PTV94753.1 multicomponent Na+:H+ antiporter subunit B [Rhodobacter aestuarii]SIS79461.1 multicomponent Na+:H+ antiporter subunit B [Rhodobacter aestuarii]
MIRNALIGLMLFILGSAFLTLTMGFEPATELNRTAAYYATHAQEEVGAQNVVTAVLITWRGLDTLGEVTVLFLTAAIVSLVLSRSKAPKGASGSGFLPSGELLTTGTKMLLPLIALLGAYVMANGHLTPGGGFQGGAILASGALLMLLADPSRRFGHKIIHRVESASGLAFVGLGLLGMLFAGGFLDNKLLPLGQFGALFSAGIIPIVSVLIGLKVGAEFASILESLEETEDA